MLQWYIRKFKGGIAIILNDKLEPVWSCERWPWSSKVDKNLEKTYIHIFELQKCPEHYIAQEIKNRNFFL